MLDERIYLVSASSLAQLLDVTRQEVEQIVALDCWPKPVELIPGCVRWNWGDCQDAIDEMIAAAAARESE